MSWLAPVIEQLDRARVPVQVFFRDDDAGWGDEALFALLDLFAAQAAPIDLAVIPQALRADLAHVLRARFDNAPDLLGLHQHGYSHANHENTGRKCEFGASRDADQQQADLAAGKQMMAQALGERVDPFFTPPWNRMTQATANALVALGFQAVSRDVGAVPLQLGGLVELPVAVDWCKGQLDETRTWSELGNRIAAAMAERSVVGVMLHHAVMDGLDLQHLSEFLSAVARHDNARMVTMREGIAVALSDVGREIARPMDRVRVSLDHALTH